MSAAMPSRSPTSTPGWALAEAGEQPGDVEVAGGQQRADPDAPAQHAAQLVDLGARAVDLGEDAAGARGDRLPGLGRGDAAARALEQRRAELLLEPADLVRQRRLGDVELLRGAREVAVPRHRLHARSCRSSTRSIVDHDRSGENYVLRRSISAAHPRRDDATTTDRRRAARAGGRPRRRLVDAADRPRQRRLRDRGERALARRGHADDGDRDRRADRAPARSSSPPATGSIVGSVRVHDVADDASEFGMLVAAPDQRGTGIGRALLDFAERRSRERGLRAMQLELLVPRGWRHPSKEFLRAWYGRRGYRLIRTGDASTTPIRTSRRCWPRRATWSS